MSLCDYHWKESLVKDAIEYLKNNLICLTNAHHMDDDGYDIEDNEENYHGE